MNSKSEQELRELRDESTQPGRTLVEDFRMLLEDMATFARTQGVTLVPYKDAGLQFYSKLPQRQRSSVYKGLRAYYESMLETYRLPLPLSVAESTAVMLEKLGLRYDPDYLATLTSENIVEIYLVESLQIFRSLHFFNLTNYTLEEICTRPWFELWERESRVTEQLLKIVGLTLDFKITGAISVLMPAHEVRDRAARLRTGSLMSPMTVVPLYDQSGSVYGYLTSYLITPVP